MTVLTATIYLFLLFLLLIGQKGSGNLSLEIREISSGIVRGRKISISFASGGSAFLFAAIPYARAPSADLRFSPPQPPNPWEGVRDATQLGPSCWWNVSGFLTDDPSLTPMDEDCLSVNVFVSERCLRLGGCAVFQYVYGGQFMYGTARKLDERTIVFLPFYLAGSFFPIKAENFCFPGRDAIVVTFGYRMNVFGLLNLNFRFSELNPPNLAIHDIVASLLWTRREIANFGGDPQRVTLAGQSSGSVATQILMLLPRTNLLFHQTISMSGPGTIEMLPKNKNERSSRRLALLVGCATNGEGNSKDFWNERENILRVLRCLRSLPARRLSAALPPLGRRSLLFHGLSLEIGADGIINDTFVNLMRRYRGKHNVMTGTVSKEFLDGTVLIDPKTGQVNTVRLAFYCRRLVRQLNYENGQNALSACINEYADARRAPLLFDDANMFVPHLLFAVNSARYNVPTFLYQFEYEAIGTAYQYAPGRFGSPLELSPRHAQDLVYLFGQNKGIFNENDRRLQHLYSALFVNFVLNGTLNGGDIKNALPFQANRSNFYRIAFADSNNRSDFVGDNANYHRRAVEFWTEKMPKVAGRRHLLRDESLIDDQMLSNYLSADLAVLGRLLVGNPRKVLWQCLFCSVFGILLLIMLTILFILRKRKNRKC